jgi:hypothetical protein
MDDIGLDAVGNESCDDVIGLDAVGNESCDDDLGLDAVGNESCNDDIELDAVDSEFNDAHRASIVNAPTRRMRGARGCPGTPTFCPGQAPLGATARIHGSAVLAPHMLSLASWGILRA